MPFILCPRLPLGGDYGQIFINEKQKALYVTKWENTEKCFVICEICNEKFKTHSDLMCHQNLHNKKSFTCQYCEKQYTYKKALRQHLVKIHRLKKMW